MKPTAVALLGLLLLVLHPEFSLARGGKGFGKGFNFKKPFFNRESIHSNTLKKNTKGTNSQAGNPRQPGRYPQQPGSYPQQPGNYPQQPGNYPQQPYRPQNPARGSPYSGGNGGVYGGYPGGYVNQNPSNKILSPRYGSAGYRGHGYGRGSPFSRSVESMNLRPDDKSRGFGRTAVMAAAGGVVAGMALGYGLGRFPRPPFSFHSGQEEYYYNHYMYRTYGVRSTDSDDYGRDYGYARPLRPYHVFMASCTNHTAAPPVAAPKKKAGAAPPVPGAGAAPDPRANISSHGDITDARNTSVSEPPTPTRLTWNGSEPGAAPPASRPGGVDLDSDTVGIEEIGYPALILQVRTRMCLERYMEYAQDYLQRNSGGRRPGVSGLLALLAGALATLLGNVLMASP